MLEYSLRLTEGQVLFLLWVEQGCPRSDENTLGKKVFELQQFIRIAHKFINTGMVTHNTEASRPAYLLTDKGEVLTWLLHMEIDERYPEVT